MFLVLDLDEVLVDFTGGAEKVFGLSVEEMGERFGDWWSGDAFWQGIIDYGERRFWENLEPLPWMVELLHWIKGMGCEWIIATTPQPRCSCYVGKLRWIQNMFPPGFNRYILTEHKHLLAREGRVLIDDSRENCNLFEAHGGESILFPSRFNCAKSHLEDPVQHVIDSLSFCFDD